jgi:TonB family protein
MFESVAPETFAPRSRRLFYEGLPMSIAAHLVVGFAFVVAGSWNVTFPDESPRMSLTYSLALPPTMPPPPPAAAAVPKQTVAPAPKQIVKREDIVAPTIIPDTIPLVLPPEELKLADIAPVGDETSGASGGVEGGVGSGDGSGGGVTGGSPLGIAGGFLGGVDGGIPADTVIVQRHHPLPTSMTPMSMVYPFYPEEARVRGWEDAVTVRYVIGKDGRVKTVTVLEAPQREVFQTNVVKAIRHWRFRPLVKNGVKHEVIHELVIHFKLNQGVG